tara:strand:+ start:204 stop:419 length:216 start_codon:yes stop_codon:yes gene_type:complete
MKAAALVVRKIETIVFLPLILCFQNLTFLKRNFSNCLFYSVFFGNFYRYFNVNIGTLFCKNYSKLDISASQ